MRFALPVLALAFSWATTGTAYAQQVTDRMQESYLAALDHWVAKGGNVNAFQSEVVQNCGKLIMLTATREEVAQFLATDQEEFHFRVDVCAKMTANRVHEQPEFKKANLVHQICNQGLPQFKLLCERSGLL
jgi:hypothetical protein